MEKKKAWTSSHLLQSILQWFKDLTRSSFGDLVTESLKIQAGWTFVYNLDPIYVETSLENGGTVTYDNGFAVLSTGTTADGKAEIHTRRSLSYLPGVGSVARFTFVFAKPQLNNQQLVGIGNGTDGWFFGYDINQKFGILRIRDSVEYWTYQEDWSEDVREDLNPQKGNVYQIAYQWLGFGDQFFAIEDNRGAYAPVHRISYANRHNDVSVRNPSQPLTARTQNFNGSITEVSCKTPSAVSGSYGDLDNSAFAFPIGYDQLEKAIGADVETYLFTLHNPPTFASLANRLYALPQYLGVASDGTKSVVITVYFDATLTGASFVDLAPGVSPIQYDESATAFSGGFKVLTIPLAKIDSQNVDLEKFRGLLSAGNSFTVTARSKNSSLITTGVTMASRV